VGTVQSRYVLHHRADHRRGAMGAS